jgi:hypothetical protein
MSSRQSIPERGKCLHFQRALIWTRDENRHVISTCRILDTCEWTGRPAIGGFNPPCQIGRAALGATCAETNVLSPQDSADLDLGVSVAEFKRRRGAELCWAIIYLTDREQPARLGLTRRFECAALDRAKGLLDVLHHGRNADSYTLMLTAYLAGRV